MELGQWSLLLTLGALVALIPLGLVWMTRGSRPLRRLAWVTAFLTFDLVVFGGFTRLTESGLGCPDWPGCFARSSPLAAAQAIDAAQAALPGGPVTMLKAWIEMIHRFLAMAVGLLIVVMMLASWWQRKQAARFPGLASAAFALVLVQGAFGALTVTQKLQPVIVTIHLLLGLSLLGLLVWHALAIDAASASADGRRPESLPLNMAIRMLAPVALLALAAQIALGGWVSTNYAVLACPDFPLCRGQWIPEMDLSHGFELWRQLGRTADQGFISTSALIAIHWVHRTFAVVAASLLGWLVIYLYRLKANVLATGLLGLLALQLGTGLGNVLLRWPLAVAVFHSAGAAALVITLVVVNYRVAQSHHSKAGHSAQTARLAAI